MTFPGALVPDLAAGDVVILVYPAERGERVGDGLGVLVPADDREPVIGPVAVDEVLATVSARVKEVGQVSVRLAGRVVVGASSFGF